MGKRKYIAPSSRLTKFEKKWFKVTRAILICIALYITACLIPTFEANTDNSNAIVILQYMPLVMTMALSIIGGIPTRFRAMAENITLDPEELRSIRRLMTPRTKENSTELGLLLYYIWEGIVIISQIVLIVLSVASASSFFDVVVNFVMGIIMGLVSYSVLTGQAYAVASESKKKKGWTRGIINRNAGREYVPSVNAYRDAHGNYYNLNGVPIATPVSVSKDK